MISKTYDLSEGWKATFATLESEQILVLEGPEGERIALDRNETKRLRDLINDAPVLNQ